MVDSVDGLTAGGSADSEVTPSVVVHTALKMFASHGFGGTKLEAIAKVSGMSKRMIHYHFGDKKGLYRHALTQAMESIAPPTEVLNRSSAVPVDGMRRFIDALFYRFQDNAEAIQLMLRENLDGILDAGENLTPATHTEMILHLERLLLLGQDSGAFRPGISADDVLLLVSSVCVLRVSNQNASLALGQVNLTNQRNTEGLRRMTIDVVLGFLTSNIPDSGYASYLEPRRRPAQVDDTTEETYSIDLDGIY